MNLRDETIRIHPQNRLGGGFLVFVVACAWSVYAQAGAPGYDRVIELGLTDELHTAVDGTRNSLSVLPIRFHPAGTAGGSSFIYDGQWWMGRSAWVFDGMETHRVGLLEDEHYGDYWDGWTDNRVDHVNATGQAGGRAERYDGSNEIGWSAWIYDGSQTVQVGLIDAEHTQGIQGDTPGYRDSRVETMNNSGQAIGRSERYGDIYSNGLSAWIYNGNDTLRLGFTDATHTDAGDDNHRVSVAEAINEAGQAFGYSRRFDVGGTNRSAWFYDGQEQHRVGFTGGQYVNGEGRQESRVVDMNESGELAGWSRIYSDAVGNLTSLGLHAWHYDHDSQTASKIGYYDDEHTRQLASGNINQHSSPFAINEAGQVIGFSRSYSDTDEAAFGSTAWLYDAETDSHSRLGLTGGDYVDQDTGVYRSTPHLLSNAGQVGGITMRPNDESFFGQTPTSRNAWFYDGEETHLVGLVDDRHTRNTGLQVSDVIALNEAGQMIGVSNRYEGGSALGQSAWFFDSATRQTHKLVFSERSDGRAFTSPEYLSETGAVFGFYNHYDADDNLTSGNLFYWSPAEGMRDLDAMLIIDPETSGWSSLGTIDSVGELNQLLGRGTVMLENGTAYDAPFLITALEVVIDPEPFQKWMDNLSPGDQPPLGQRGRKDTPAGDGVANLLKYAFGLLPMEPAADAQPKLVTVEGKLALEFSRKPDANVLYLLEGSYDLNDWTEVTIDSENTTSLPDEREFVQMVTDHPVAAEDPYFLRLRVYEP
jgi:hypothetical protein